MVPEEHGDNVQDLLPDNTVVALVQEAPHEHYPPLVSIVVACRTVDTYVKECIFECLQLDYPHFELIVLPDDTEDLRDKRVKVLPTGPVRPSEKRNLGVDAAKGEVIAFIDGDAYPTRDWLRNAVRYFQYPKVAAVGGPGLTPESDTVMQKASGEILSSFFGTGPLSFRHSPKVPRKCDDMPSVNLIVLKSVFKDLGGFNSSSWPGEDTKFCRDLVYERGNDILYAPDVQVFHHRRILFRPHLKQIAGYGLHRGYFSKKYPENSRKPLYFMPSILALGLPVFLILGYLNAAVKTLAIFFASAYLLAVLIGALLVGLKHRNGILAVAVLLGTLATHLWYGTYFVKGLLSRKIDTHSPGYKSNI